MNYLLIQVFHDISLLNILNKLILNLIFIFTLSLLSYFSLGTKFMKGWHDLACGIALDAVKCVRINDQGGYNEIDIKRYAKVEKVTN